jgi:hypothetical protein
MNHHDAIRLEHLLLDLLKRKRGKTLTRGQKYEGITVDADALENDAKAVPAMWLAIELLSEEPK